MKASGAKTTGKSILVPNQNAGNVPMKKESGKTVEQIYQKKSQLEHILLRPGTHSKYYGAPPVTVYAYLSDNSHKFILNLFLFATVGSVERVLQPMFVLDAATERIVEREITFTPSLYKIFDEIVVNASQTTSSATLTWTNLRTSIMRFYTHLNRLSDGLATSTEPIKIEMRQPVLVK